MSEQTVVAAPSAVETPVIEVERGPLVTWTPEQRSHFRNTGEMPEPPKKEESAPSDATKESTSEAEKPEPAGETEPPKPQETPRKPGNRAEQRIKELLSETKRLEAEVASLKAPKPAVEAPKPIEQSKPQPQPTRPKPTIEDKNEDGTPKFKAYEDFVEDLADWKAEQRLAQAERTQAQQAQQRALEAKISEAKNRYEKFDEVVRPAFTAITTDQAISGVVKAMLNDSELLPDLLFTIGSDQKELDAFVEMAKKQPGKAIRYIALTESLIRDELESKAKPETKEPPAKPQTSAPKPPSEVGGRAATPSDEMAAAAKANDFRKFKAEGNRRDLARLKA